MQQKVQFIAAVLHEPDFMILDEPFSGLDPGSSLQLKDVLLELKKQGRTILFSTHRMDTVERLCDSICLVNQGRSVLRGSAARDQGQLRPQPRAAGVRGRTAAAGRPRAGRRLQRLRQLRRAAPGARTPIRSSLLALAMQHARIRRFEMVEPSLEEIFLRRSNRTQGGAHAMRNLLLIIRREYLVRVRTRAFLLFTVLMPLLVGGMVVLPGKLMMHEPSTRRVAIVAADPRAGERRSRPSSPASRPDRAMIDEPRAAGERSKAAASAEFDVQPSQGAPSEALRQQLTERAPRRASSTAFAWIDADAARHPQSHLLLPQYQRFYGRLAGEPRPAPGARASASLPSTASRPARPRPCSARSRVDTVRVDKQGANRSNGLGAFCCPSCCCLPST